jgi:hypothetical protein
MSKGKSKRIEWFTDEKVLFFKNFTFGELSFFDAGGRQQNDWQEQTPSNVFLSGIMACNGSSALLLM